MSTKTSFLNQRGFSNLLMLLVLLGGIAVGVYLLNSKGNFFSNFTPKASGAGVSYVDVNHQDAGDQTSVLPYLKLVSPWRIEVATDLETINPSEASASSAGKLLDKPTKSTVELRRYFNDKSFDNASVTKKVDLAKNYNQVEKLGYLIADANNTYQTADVVPFYDCLDTDTKLNGQAEHKNQTTTANCQPNSAVLLGYLSLNPKPDYVKLYQCRAKNGDKKTTLSADCKDQGDRYSYTQRQEFGYILTKNNPEIPKPTKKPNSNSGVYTKAIILADDPNFTTNKEEINYFFEDPIYWHNHFLNLNPGKKTIYAKFISSKGEEKVYSDAIEYNPAIIPSATPGVYPSPLIINPYSSDLACLDVSVVGANKVSYPWGDVYNLASGGTAKLIANVTPKTSRVDWRLASSTLLPNAGKVEPNLTSEVVFTAPSNPNTSEEGVTIYGWLSEYPSPYVSCPTLTFAIQPQSPNR